MSPKTKSAAPTRSTKAGAGAHSTGPKVETFEPSHGPNLEDRSDLLTPSSEAEKAGGND